MTDDPAAIGAFARILCPQDRVVLQLEPVAGSWTGLSARPERILQT